MECYLSFKHPSMMFSCIIYLYFLLFLYLNHLPCIAMILNPDEGRQFAASLGCLVTHNTLQAVDCVHFWTCIDLYISLFLWHMRTTLCSILKCPCKVFFQSSVLLIWSDAEIHVLNNIEHIWNYVECNT
jgi:hypothetical protein